VEVKTDDFDIHSPRSQAFFAKVKLPEIRREARLAKECGYNFAVGVKSTAHKEALEKLDRTLTIVVMEWC
jgi:transposase-like protein